jgi:ferredoxin
MAHFINDDCISCGACESECPVNAISTGDDHNQIDETKCVDCVGHFDKPQCVAACPVDAIQAR